MVFEQGLQLQQLFKPGFSGWRGYPQRASSGRAVKAVNQASTPPEKPEDSG
jgi:hypothetical protein